MDISVVLDTTTVFSSPDEVQSFQMLCKRFAWLPLFSIHYLQRTLTFHCRRYRWNVSLIDVDNQ
ncbi:hypothetical protein AHF37_02461 [Paragonimus kellicotti]|nr:hypothetical protein AHF37_02461 [Paragonimus kellicotti]